VLLVGIGKREKLDRERLRRAAAVAVKEAAKRRISRVASILHHAEMADEEISPEDAAQSVAEGAVLAGYRFDEMKSAPGEDDEPPAEVGEYAILEKLEEKAARLEEGARVGAAVARGQSLARTLGNLPGTSRLPPIWRRRRSASPGTPA
jgi:leucyl aminopeptidase